MNTYTYFTVHIPPYLPTDRPLALRNAITSLVRDSTLRPHFFFWGLYIWVGNLHKKYCYNDIHQSLYNLKGTGQRKTLHKSKLISIEISLVISWRTKACPGAKKRFAWIFHLCWRAAKPKANLTEHTSTLFHSPLYRADQNTFIIHIQYSDWLWDLITDSKQHNEVTSRRTCQNGPLGILQDVILSVQYSWTVQLFAWL